MTDDTANEAAPAAAEWPLRPWLLAGLLGLAGLLIHLVTQGNDDVPWQMAAGALAFTGLSWLVLVLMSELFHLLRIDFLRELMDESAFGWTFSGLAAGAALGTLRNQLKVLGTLQTVVLLVLSLLAVPLAAGLVVFLLATAISGPQVLWDATRRATP